jgi:xanthine dehydrogenase YagT iron-sulfur-binding subunit
MRCPQAPCACDVRKAFEEKGVCSRSRRLQQGLRNESIGAAEHDAEGRSWRMRMDDRVRSVEPLDRRLEEPGPVLGPNLASLGLTVNGRDVIVRVDPGTTLAEVLRDGLGLTGTKIGCDRGACSACTVWLDRDAIAACMTLAFDARGRHVTTIEGLTARSESLHPVQQAFIDCDAMQCGFCTPGMVMSCAWLVESNPGCTVDDITSTVSGHLCRCGAYSNIIKATLAAAEKIRGTNR